nr:MAG TPA_asm: hypothetical protein [Caudoviricetes sp.]
MKYEKNALRIPPPVTKKSRQWTFDYGACRRRSG